MASGSTITGYRIKDLDDVQTPLTNLANAYFEVEQPLGPVAGGYTNLRLRGDRLTEWLSAVIGPDNRGSNLRPGGPFYTTTLTTASIGYVAGNARDELKPALLCLGAICRSEFNDATDATRSQGQVDKLVYDPHGPLQVYLNGNATGARNYPARWVRADSPEAYTANWAQLQANPPAADYAFTEGELVRWAVAPSTTESFFSALSDGVWPAPTAEAGDAHWLAVDRNAVPIPGAASSFRIPVASGYIVGSGAGDTLIFQLENTAAGTTTDLLAVGADSMDLLVPGQALVLHSPDNTPRPLAVDDTRHLLLDGDPLAGFALPWAPGRAFLAGELTFYNGTLYRLAADQGGGLGTPTVVGPTIYQPLASVGGGFDTAAFIASIDTAASNVSASISSTTGKLVLIATL
jgi:hypothetical protein